MELTISRKILASAFGDVAACIPTRTPKPILQNVLLIARDLFNDDGCGVTSSLIATDLEMGVRSIINPHVKEAGSVLLPAVKLKEILGKATAEDITIQTLSGGDKIRIRCGKAKWELPSEDAGHFPPLPTFDYTAYHEVAAHDMLKLISRTIFATDPESTRYALGGVMAELSETEAKFVSTDGRRMAEARSPVNVVGTPATFVNGPKKDDKGKPIAGQADAPVIPVRMLKLVASLLKHDDSPVHIGIKPLSAVMIRTGQAEVYSRLVEGRFPRYQDAIPSERSPCRLSLTAGPLREALEQAAVATSEETRGVDLDVSPGLLSLKSSAADVGSADVELEIVYDGPAASVTFDPRYVLDFLRAIGDDAALILDVSQKEGNLFQTEDAYKYVAMPLTRDR